MVTLQTIENFVKLNRDQIRKFKGDVLEVDTFVKAWNTWRKHPGKDSLGNLHQTYDELLAALPEAFDAPQESCMARYAVTDDWDGIYNLVMPYDWELGYVHPVSLREGIEARELIVGVDSVNNVIGFVHFHIRKRDPGVTLYTIAVKGSRTEGDPSDLRRTGIGTLMVMYLKAETSLRVGPGSRIRTKVMEQNEPAIAFFRRNCFEFQKAERSRNGKSMVHVYEWQSDEPDSLKCPKCGYFLIPLDLKQSQFGGPSGRCQRCHESFYQLEAH